MISHLSAEVKKKKNHRDYGTILDKRVKLVAFKWVLKVSFHRFRGFCAASKTNRVPAHPELILSGLNRIPGDDASRQ